MAQRATFFSVAMQPRDPRLLPLRLAAAAAALAAAATSAARPLLGAEFTSVPAATSDLTPVAEGGWTVATGSARAPSAALRAGDRPAAVDADGWPTEDAYLIFFIATPDVEDLAQFVPRHTYGAFALSFVGKAAAVELDPRINATVSGLSFDAATWTTTATVTLGPPLPGLAIGFAGTQRSADAPPGSGVTRVRLLQPGVAPAGPAPPLFTPDAVAAVAPFFAHVRFMEFTQGDMIVGFANASSPGLGIAVEWADRTLLSDALWGRARAKSFGAPWEAVVLFAQAARVGVWVCVPAQASDDYVRELALLLRDGSELTGGSGVPGAIYMEHSNEVWLNGSAAANGGPSAAYLYNRAAATAEVAANASSILNIDGVDDPEIWAYRRHLRRVAEIGAIFVAVFEGQADRVRPVLGWCQNFERELEGLGAWWTAALAPRFGPVGSALYGVAVNAYSVGGVAPGATEADIVAAVRAASDAQRPARAATAALAAQGGLRFMTYEGALVCIPVMRDAPTTSAIIEANRREAWAAAVRYDYEANWAQIAGAAEFNFFALASRYGEDFPTGRFQWGLTEDISNTTTPKFGAVRAILGGGGAAGQAEEGDYQ